MLTMLKYFFTLVFFGINIVLVLYLGKSTDDYIRNLHSENITLQIEAVFQLGDKKEEAVPVLLDLLTRGNSPQTIRLDIIEALGNIQDKRATDVLLSLLKDGNQDIRLSALNSLGQIKDPKSVGPIIKLLDQPQMVSPAIRALGDIRQEEAVPKLTALLTHPDESVRYQSRLALKRIGKIY